MSEFNSNFTPDQKTSLQRIATLQRLREEARDGNRPSMLDTIEKLIEMETRALRESCGVEARPE